MFICLTDLPSITNYCTRCISIAAEEAKVRNCSTLTILSNFEFPVLLEPVQFPLPVGQYIKHSPIWQTIHLFLCFGRVKILPFKFSAKEVGLSVVTFAIELRKYF